MLSCIVCLIGFFWFKFLLHIGYNIYVLCAHSSPLFIGFPRQEYCSKLPFPTPTDLRDPGIEPVSLVSPALVGGLFTTNTAWEVPYNIYELS